MKIIGYALVTSVNNEISVSAFDTLAAASSSMMESFREEFMRGLDHELADIPDFQTWDNVIDMAIDGSYEYDGLFGFDMSSYAWSRIDRDIHIDWQICTMYRNRDNTFKSWYGDLDPELL